MTDDHCPHCGSTDKAVRLNGEGQPEDYCAACGRPCDHSWHTDGGDIIVVIGPECFATEDGSVICWKGENYVRQEAAEQRLQKLGEAAKQEQVWKEDAWQRERRARRLAEDALEDNVGIGLAANVNPVTVLQRIRDDILAPPPGRREREKENRPAVRGDGWILYCARTMSDGEIDRLAKLLLESEEK